MPENKGIVNHVITNDFEVQYHRNKGHFQLTILRPVIEGVGQVSVMIPDDLVRQMFDMLDSPNSQGPIVT